MASASSVPGSSDQLASIGRLKCPLCLKEYKDPRLLSCLHMFCMKCIYGQIMEATDTGPLRSSIVCPVCKKATQSPAPTSPKADWAKGLAVYRNASGSGRNGEPFCDTCASDNKTSLARFVCKECNSHQCDQCMFVHNRYPTLRKHTVIDLQHTPKQHTTIVNFGQTEYCQKHANKKLKFHCEDHKLLLCSSCVIADHRACGHVMELTRLGQELKTGNRPHQIKQKMMTLKTQLSEINHVLKSNSDDVEKQTDMVVRKVKDVRNKVVQMFDDLVLQVSAQCTKMKETLSQEIAKTAFHHDGLTAAIDSSLAVLESAVDHGTDTQCVIVLNKLDQQTGSYEDNVRTPRGNTSITEIGLTIAPAVESLLQIATPLAEVTCSKSRVEFDHQSDFIPTPPIVECTVQKSPLMTIQKRCQWEQPWFNAIACLPDGRIVAADFNNSLCCLLDASCNVISDLKLHACPYSLTWIGGNEIALVQRGLKEIKLVAIDTALTLSRSIPCQRKPRCVARAGNGELAVGWEEGFGIIDMDGTEKSYVAVDTSGKEIEFSKDCRIAVDSSRSRLYHTKSSTNTVYCYQLDGQVVFTYSDQLRDARGMALDRDGNVYVCSWDSACVHQVSPAGDRISVIHTGLNPYSLCFTNSGDTMLLMDIDVDGSTSSARWCKFVSPL